MATPNDAPTKGHPWLPPGFRFHPTDEELVSFYLAKKFQNPAFTAGPVIFEADFSKCEPWDLPGSEAEMGEKRYFYSLRDRKYPKGMRVNRATKSGYWKATGKDREIRNSRSSCLVGMRKTLVFYKGRPPRGEKTNWILHEYRMKSTHSAQHLDTKISQDEWAIYRIFGKAAGGGKTPSENIRRRPSFLDGILLSESHDDRRSQENAPQKHELVSNSHHQLAASFSKTAPSSLGSAAHSNSHLAPALCLQITGASSNYPVRPPPLRMMGMLSSNAAFEAVPEQVLDESVHADNVASCKPMPVSLFEKVTILQHIDEGDLLDLPAGQPVVRYAVSSELNGQSYSLQTQAIEHSVSISSDFCEKAYDPAVFSRLGYCSSNNSSLLDLGTLWTY